MCNAVAVGRNAVALVRQPLIPRIGGPHVGQWRSQTSDIFVNCNWFHTQW